MMTVGRGCQHHFFGSIGRGVSIFIADPLVVQKNFSAVQKSTTQQRFDSQWEDFKIRPLRKKGRKLCQFLILAFVAQTKAHQSRHDSEEGWHWLETREEEILQPESGDSNLFHQKQK